MTRALPTNADAAVLRAVRLRIHRRQPSGVSGPAAARPPTPQTLSWCTGSGKAHRARYPAAYGQLCEQVRDRMTQEEFARTQASQPKLLGYEIIGVNVTSVNGHVGGSTTVRLAQENGAEIIQIFPMVKEGGDWRVCQ